MSNINSELWALATPDARLIAAAIDELTAEVRSLNTNLEAGTVNIRVHHPKCVAPAAPDATSGQEGAL